MNKLLISFLALCSAAMLSSCYNDYDNSEDIASNTPDAPIIVSTIISGMVMDNGNSISDYSLSVQDDIAEVVDPQVLFYSEVNDVNKKGQAIYVYRNDQLIAMTHTQLIENDINYLEIELFDNYQSKSLEPTNEISINNNVSASIAAERFQDINGNTLTNAMLSYRDLSTLGDMAQLGRSGFNAKEDLLALQHVAAWELRLFQSDEEIISSKGGITLNINNDEKNSRLFHFDESDEKWRSIQVLNVGQNEVVVNNTGFYSISSAQEAIYVDGTIRHEGQDVSFQKLHSDLTPSIISSYNGKWLDIVPQSSDINYEIKSPCGTVQHSQAITTSETDITAAIIEDNSDSYYQFSPVIYNCEAEPITVNALSIGFDNDVQGIYPFLDNKPALIGICMDDFLIAGYDIQSATKHLSLPWSRFINADNISLLNCGEYNNGYSYIKIGADKEILQAFEFSNTQETSTFQSTDEKIKFIFKGTDTGLYNENEINIKIEDMDFGISGYRMSCLNSTIGCGMEQWNVTHYKAGVEKWVRVDFSGELWMQTINPAEAGYFPVSGIILCQAPE